MIRIIKKKKKNTSKLITRFLIYTNLYIFKKTVIYISNFNDQLNKYFSNPKYVRTFLLFYLFPFQIFFKSIFSGIRSMIMSTMVILNKIEHLFDSNA